MAHPGAFGKKAAAASRIREAGLPLTLNFVLYRGNVARAGAMIAFAEAQQAARLEMAHVQYYGWGLRNRAALLPTRDQLDAVTEQVEAARARLRGRMVIDYVVPDYHASRPKACMGGWAQRIINISPSGRAMPCHAAEDVARLHLSQRGRARSGLDLGVLGRFHAFPRHGVDARALPEL